MARKFTYDRVLWQRMAIYAGLALIVAGLSWLAYPKPREEPQGPYNALTEAMSLAEQAGPDYGVYGRRENGVWVFYVEKDN